MCSVLFLSSWLGSLGRASVTCQERRRVYGVRRGTSRVTKPRQAIVVDRSAAARKCNNTKGSGVIGCRLRRAVRTEIPQNRLVLCFATTQEFSRILPRVTIGRFST